MWCPPSAGSIVCCTLVFSTFNDVLSEPYFSSPVFKMNLSMYPEGKRTSHEQYDFWFIHIVFVL